MNFLLSIRPSDSNLNTSPIEYYEILISVQNPHCLFTRSKKTLNETHVIFYFSNQHTNTSVT